LKRHLDGQTKQIVVAGCVGRVLGLAHDERQSNRRAAKSATTKAW
jgi:hypothetical protein